MLWVLPIIIGMIKQKIVQESVYNTNKYKCRTGFVCIGNFD